MNQYKIGVDLGGTKIEVLLLDQENHQLHRSRIPTPQGKSYPAILQSLGGLIRDTSRSKKKKKNYSIGIGIPGTINYESQLVQNANTTCLIGKPLQKDLENLLGRRIGIENDANCFTLAESLLGAAKGYSLVFGIIMGTGCGGGICIDGHIRQGSNGIAGEWGHFAVDPSGAKCYCGNRGCVETKISGSGVETAFYKNYHRHLSMREIVEKYRRGDDPSCNTAFEHFLDDFGRCLGGLVSTLDPDAVVLGGGLSNIDELYGKGIERVLHYAFHQHIKTPILKNELGDSAGVFGAAWVGRNELILQRRP